MMAQKVVADTFRSSFKVVEKDLLHWFPGHMGRSLKTMQHKLRAVDCIIEVHDARIPFSGRNADFKYTITGIKPQILVLNKKDLIDKKLFPKITDHLKKEYKHVLFTNCKDQSCSGVKELLPLAKDLIKSSNRFNREVADDYGIMVIGVPNVGKSSLINILRNKNLNKANASPVGAQPGITKSVMTKIKLSEKPLVYVLDTPGILTPSVPNIEVGLKLAVCAALHDHLVGSEVVADYLLYLLNKYRCFEYVDVFNLKGPNDNILDVLAQISMNSKKYLRSKDTSTGSYVLKPDFNSAANLMLRAFRSGELGKVMLDENVL